MIPVLVSLVMLTNKLDDVIRVKILAFKIYLGFLKLWRFSRYHFLLLRRLCIQHFFVWWHTHVDQGEVRSLVKISVSESVWICLILQNSPDPWVLKLSVCVISVWLFENHQTVILRQSNLCLILQRFLESALSCVENTSAELISAEQSCLNMSESETLFCREVSNFFTRVMLPTI